MLHKLSQQISPKYSQGSEMSPETSEINAQRQVSSNSRQLLDIYLNSLLQTSHHPALPAPPGDQHGAGRQGEGDRHRAPG